MISLIHSLFHLMDVTANLFLIIMGAITLPSALMGCISIAAQRHRQRQQNLAMRAPTAEAEAPQESQAEAIPESTQTLLSSTTDINTEIYSGIDPLETTAELQESAQVKTTLPAPQKTLKALATQPESPKTTSANNDTNRAGKQTTQAKTKPLSPLAAFLVERYGDTEKTPETSK